MTSDRARMLARWHAGLTGSDAAAPPHTALGQRRARATQPQGVTVPANSNFEIALQRFKDVTARLSQAWESADGDILGESYPDYLPSFDEFAFDVQGMTVAEKPPGRRIELIRTSDPHTRLQPGAQGTVTFVDSLGTVHARWDDGSTLGLIPGHDAWKELS